MNSVGQRLRDALWFFPLDKFIIVFGLYAFMSVSTLLIRGTGIFSALLATFGFGIVFFVFAIVVERNRGLFGNGIRDDKPFASRLLFGPIKDPKTNAVKNKPILVLGSLGTWQFSRQMSSHLRESKTKISNGVCASTRLTRLDARLEKCTTRLSILVFS